MRALGHRLEKRKKQTVISVILFVLTRKLG
jgi:hypothetical protein